MPHSPAELSPAELSPAETFWLAHEGLPRQAPGSPETTRQLITLAGGLPAAARAVDVGCGTGPAALQLAVEFGARVAAVDIHLPFLERLRDAAAAAGLADRVTPLVARMESLPLPDGTADVVWADGSAYLMGFDAALASWRRLLAPGGVLILTEAEWTTRTPAAPARAFWDAGYPRMRATDGNTRAALDAGWTVVASYLLPDADWSAYYDPFAARLAELAGRPGLDAAALGEMEREIAVRREHGGDYGYRGYVLRPGRHAER
ncbi:class I SAM-dependent methyltransferase [Pseudonocardia sp. GCM10023141]|uniref:class I SAM-dependent methyltransferase n=1 Tax=Pseudonocardia sp. GCM10023141 TaxID=3252653 RepID=UPI0036234217